MPQRWQLVRNLPPLNAGELHVWRILLPELGSGTGDPNSYSWFLPPEEVSRAARLRVPYVRLQFVIARAALRTLLGDLLALHPLQVHLEAGAHGKPELPGHSLRFNIAHTSGVILIALSPDCNLGVDIEYVDREVEALDIARSSFSASEIRELELIAGSPQLEHAFFQCWTRKEAIIKADGRGLSIPLTSFDVPVIGPVSAAAIRVPGSLASTSTVKTFYLSDLPCGDALTAAVALESPNVRLRQFDFPLSVLTLSS